MGDACWVKPLRTNRSRGRGGVPRFSRTGNTSPLGKLDDRVEAFRVESEVKSIIEQVAAREGKGLAEFLREVMRVLAFGPSKIKSMHARQVDEVVRMLGDVGKE